MTLKEFRSLAIPGECFVCGNSRTLIVVFKNQVGAQFPSCFLCSHTISSLPIPDHVKVLRVLSILLDTLKPPAKPRAPKVLKLMTRRK